jgi:hypothetical protein
MTAWKSQLLAECADDRSCRDLLPVPCQPLGLRVKYQQLRPADIVFNSSTHGSGLSIQLRRFGFRYWEVAFPLDSVTWHLSV